MNQATVKALTNQLLRQRAILVGEVADAETDLRFIAEDRETDFEEHAQKERAAHLLAHLDEQGKRKIEEIDAALRRITEGTYGTCDGCKATITHERLRALPATRFCVACAHAQEQLRPIIAEEEASSQPGPVPPDLGFLSDSEREEEIRERVRNDGRVDLEELRIVYRHGVVHFDGARHLEDAVSPQITNNRDQVQSHTNDEYGNAEQDTHSETPYTEPMPEIKGDTKQPDDGAANGRSQQTWVVRLFW